jgi:DNA polymerase III subunit epsilon
MNDNILYFDIECSSLSLHTAKIISISFILGNRHQTFLIDPEIPIPLESSRVHGIYDKDVVGCKPFRYYAPKILKILECGDTYGGYNLRKFDMVLLTIEMLRCGLSVPEKPIIDIYELTSSLFRSLRLKDIFLTLTGKTFNAHNSLDDIIITRELHQIIMDRFLKTNN